MLMLNPRNKKKTDRNIIIKNKKCSSHGFFFFLQREGRVVTLSQRAKASLEIFCLVPELIIIRDFRPLLSAEEKILFDDKNKKQGQN
jgi:hypothetical protein